MDDFRTALIISRIAAAVLYVLGVCWLFAWGTAAVNDWVFTGSLTARSSSFRLAWITYAFVYWAAGVIVQRFSHQIAKFATKASDRVW